MPRPRRSALVPADLARLRFPSEPRISPDGRWVVHVQMTSSLSRNRSLHHLHLVETRTSRQHAWTHGEQSDTSPTWTPDSRAVVFVSDRGGQPGLWRIGRQAAQPERLLELDGRIGSPRVSPDGRAVAFVFTPRSPLAPASGRNAPVPGPQARRVTRLGYKRDGIGYHDTWTHLWVLDLASRRARQITFGEADDADPAWSPDGRHLAFVSNRIERADVRFEHRDVYIVPARGGRLRRLTDVRGPKRGPAWSPDGRRIAYLGHARFPDTVENTHLWVVPAGAGKARDRCPDADLMCEDVLLSDARELGGATPPLWSADGRRIFFLASRHGEVNVWEVNARGGEPVQRSYGPGHIADFTQDAAGRQWALLRLTPQSPGEIFLATASPRREDDDAVASPPPAAPLRRAAALGPLVLGGCLNPVDSSMLVLGPELVLGLRVLVLLLG
jgi:dipeptidyl aminopeptidase/acylaminoacyl peptidase